MRHSSRPPPHGREHAWLETGGNPDARGTDLPKSRASGSRTPATGLPRPPIRQRYELSYAAHPEATQVAGGAVVCVRAVGPPEGRTTRSWGVATHLRRGPRSGSRTQPEGAAGTHAAAVRAPVRARAERAWGHGERVVAVPQHATWRCGGRAGMVCGGGWARGACQTVPASHVDDEACVSFCMLREGKSANDPPPRAHHHHASGSFMC